MKSQVLHTVWCNISADAAGEIWSWSLAGVKGLNSLWKPYSCQLNHYVLCVPEFSLMDAQRCDPMRSLHFLGDGVRCYTCYSEISFEDCHKTLRETDCDTTGVNETCAKYTGENREGKPTTFYAKACSEEKYCNDDNYHCCKVDLCNTGGIIGLSSGLALVAWALIHLVLHYWYEQRRVCEEPTRLRKWNYNRYSLRRSTGAAELVNQ